MAFNTSYDLVTAREDLGSKVISKGDNSTKLLNSLEMIRKEKVKNIKHEWSEFTIRDGAANAQAQNFTPSTTSVVPSRVYNYTQIMQTAFGMSNTELEVMDVAGIQDMYSWTAEQQFTALRKDINYALIENTASVSGLAGTGSQLLGMFGAVTTNTSAPAATTSVFTEAEFIAMVRSVEDQTGEVEELVCHTGSLNIQRITDFTGLGKTQYVDESNHTHNRLVNIVITNFGNVKLVTDNKVGNAQIGLFNFKTWALAYARMPKLTPLPATTDGKSAFWVTELTLEFLHEQANAKMTGIATA